MKFKKLDIVFKSGKIQSKDIKNKIDEFKNDLSLLLNKYI